MQSLLSVAVFISICIHTIYIYIHIYIYLCFLKKYVCMYIYIYLFSDHKASNIDSIYTSGAVVVVQMSLS